MHHMMKIHSKIDFKDFDLKKNKMKKKKQPANKRLISIGVK